MKTLQQSSCKLSSESGRAAQTSAQVDEYGLSAQVDECRSSAQVDVHMSTRFIINSARGVPSLSPYGGGGWPFLNMTLEV
eukprot:1140819-Pelagomonas_calceolata.AAC.6